MKKLILALLLSSGLLTAELVTITGTIKYADDTVATGHLTVYVISTFVNGDDEIVPQGTYWDVIIGDAGAVSTQLWSADSSYEIRYNVDRRSQRFTAYWTVASGSGTALIKDIQTTTAVSDSSTVETSQISTSGASDTDWMQFDGSTWGPLNIDDLTADGTPDSAADYVASWDADAGVMKKVLVSTLLAASASAHGQLYEDSAGTEISITTGGTFVKWVSSTAGISNLTTLSTDNDNITIDTGGGGVYLVAFQVSYEGNTNEVYHWAIFVEGVKVNEASSERKIAPNDMGSLSGVGLVALVATDVVDLRVTSTTNTTTATVNHVQLTITRIGL